MHIKMLIKCLKGIDIALLVIIPYNLPYAIILPVKVIVPMKTEMDVSI